MIEKETQRYEHSQSIIRSLLFRFLARIPFWKVITRWNVVVAATIIMGVNWIFQPLFGLISCFFVGGGYESISRLSLFRSRIPNGYQVSMISWLSACVCVCAIYPYLLFRLSWHFLSVMVCESHNRFTSVYQAIYYRRFMEICMRTTHSNANEKNIQKIK